MKTVFLLNSGEMYYFLLILLPTMVISMFNSGKNKLKEKLKYEKSFKGEDYDLIKCTTFNGIFEIERTDGDKIELEAIIYSKKPVNIDQADKYINISTKNRELIIKAKTYIWDDTRIGAVDYKFKIPEKISFDADTANGSIEAMDINGGLNLKTANGDITVNNAGGEVMVKTANGDVKINGGVIAKIRTANGDIELLSIEQFMVESSNGNINIKSDKISDDSNASSARGNIELKINPFKEASLTTRMGSINIKGFDMEEPEKKTLIGGESKTLNSTGNYKIDVNTSLGNITLKKI